MSATPNLLFMNQNAGVREWFWREPSLSRLKEYGYELPYNETDQPLTAEQWADRLVGVDALITTWGSPRLDEAVLGKNDTLRIVAHVGGSVAVIISDYLYERGVKVSTSNDLMARSVAESGIMLMMMAMRRAHVHCKFGLRSEKMVWGKDLDIKVPQDCVIGIWGYGDVAKWVVDMLRPMEPKEIAVASGHMSEQALAELGMTKCDVDELFAKSDVVFCLTGMTVANYHRIQTPQLQSMKDGAILINLGRAPLLNPDDLLAELKRGRITAALDVFEKEPLAEDDPLNDLPNVILQPHNAGTGRDAHYLAVMLDEVHRFFAGEPLQYEIARERGEQMTDLGKVREVKG